MVTASDMTGWGLRPCECGRAYKRTRAPWTCVLPGCIKTLGRGGYAAAGTKRATAEPSAHPAPSRPGKSWSRAVATSCGAGHNHPSKMEARVCGRLTAEAASCGATLFRQVRFPLFSLAPTDSGLPLYITVDFVLELPSGINHTPRRYIDAKHPKRVSREWRRGAAAFHSCYGAKIEEVAS